MIKVALKLDLHDVKEQSKALRIASRVDGVGSLNIDTKDNKLTVAGDMDPIELLGKLRKRFHTEILSVGPVKRAHPPPLYNYGRYVTV